MIVGFTGVIWEARPAERLAHDLHHGVGPARLAETGAAWTALATELVDIGVAYGKILADLGLHWESGSYNHAFEKLTQFAPWFADAANQAMQTAAKAEAQAAANAVALTAMPNPLEIAATKAIAEALSKVEAAAGSPIMAAAANNERAHQDQGQRASRVMESYERAATPVADPWKLPAPPRIVSDAALNAEEAAAREAAAQAKAVAHAAGIHGGLATAPLIGGIGGFGGGYDIPREKSNYAATELAADGHPVSPLVAPGGPAEPTRAAGHMPMAPMGAGAAAVGNSNDDEHRPAPVAPNVSRAAGAGADVHLPAGWLQAGEQDAPVSWSDIADRYQPPALPPLPEGVLDLGDGSVAPAVLGAPEEGDQA
ncbi:PPE domain-containing protein [Gordonia rhizosphera]|uniref:PPE domain-containing protein n=1 Tax=Gordonia rhizosphera NBRC 16068 TaxID=1108045 RepID=K6V7K6_9ACTN|nr:PPE domain-containing protein [Gordonia rhizosphera]GAB92213.1 hypothetical protein GORHZ_168_00100 [Gordonia rhizosphera NBRC 16068]